MGTGFQVHYQKHKCCTVAPLHRCTETLQAIGERKGALYFMKINMAICLLVS